MKNNIATLIVIIMAAVFALPVMAQPQQFNGATAPQATFQSTNTMMGSGSRYSSNPMLNSDGMAVYNGASYGPNKTKKDYTPGTPSTPGQGKDEYQFPIGDPVLPLTLMCLLAAGVVYLRRRRAS